MGVSVIDLAEILPFVLSMAKDARTKDPKPMVEKDFIPHNAHKDCVDKTHKKKVYTQVSSSRVCLLLLSFTRRIRRSREISSITIEALRSKRIRTFRSRKANSLGQGLIR
jgi:hypothetical protein